MRRLFQGRLYRTQRKVSPSSKTYFSDSFSQQPWIYSFFITLLLHGCFMVFFLKGSSFFQREEKKKLIVRHYTMHERKVPRLQTIKREEKKGGASIPVKEIAKKALCSPPEISAKKPSLSKEKKESLSSKKAAIPAFAAKEMSPKKTNPKKQEVVSSKEKQEVVEKIVKEPHSVLQGVLPSDQLKVPQKISSLEVEEEQGKEEISENNWEEKLSEHCKKSLHLPAYGAVQVELTISSEGKVVEISFLDVKSDENKKYLQEVLPQLFFPWWKNCFSEVASRTITIVFKNE